MQATGDATASGIDFKPRADHAPPRLKPLHFSRLGKAKVPILPLTSSPISSPPSLCSSPSSLPAIYQARWAQTSPRALALPFPCLELPCLEYLHTPSPPPSSLYPNIIFSMRPTLLSPLSCPLFMQHLYLLTRLLLYLLYWLLCLPGPPNASSMGPGVSAWFITDSLVPRAVSGIKHSQ